MSVHNTTRQLRAAGLTCYTAVANEHEELATVNIKCTMKARWIPHFLAMLAEMEAYGSQGHSANVAMFADGDGDFNPQFSWDENKWGKDKLPSPINRKSNGQQPTQRVDCDAVFDAG